MRSVFVFFVLFCSISAKAQVITTVAGTGMPGDTGDGAQATAAKIYYPTFVVFDRYGNYYFTENSHVVRKVSPCGVISTIAGNGTAGFSGDGSVATAAQLNGPLGVAIDTANNIYINDCQNQRVRKIDASSGIITTYAGNGIAGYSGDGMHATNASINGVAHIACDKFGNLFISDHSNNRIRKVNSLGIITTNTGIGISGYSGDGGHATMAKISLPLGVACDAHGNLYIVEGGCLGVRRVDAVTHTISTVAGSGTVGFSGDGGPATNAQFWGPLAVTCDDAGNIYIADKGNERVRKVDTFGIISTVAGIGVAGYGGDGGPATAATLYYPEGVACNSSGNLYIADFVNHRIRKVTYNTNDTLAISITGPSTISAGSIVTINALILNTGSSYIIHWLNRGLEFTTTTVPTVTYTKGPGIDTITARIVPTGYGCWDSTTSSGHIIYTNTTGASPLSTCGEGPGVRCYPNPAHSLLTIVTAVTNGDVTVTNIVGQLLHKQPLTAKETTIDIAHLPAGVYIIKVAGDGVQMITRIVKE